jgi:hypothetical protein
MGRLVTLLVLVVLVLAGVFIWPTVWNERTAAIAGRQVQLRTHRVSGKMQLLTPSGWRPLGRPVSTTDSFTPVPCPGTTKQEWDDNVFVKIVCQEPK